MNLLQYSDEFQKTFPAPRREEAFDFLRRQGLPNRQNEDWKYTSLKVLNEKNYQPSVATNLPSSQEGELRRHLAGFASHAVFINGVFQSQLSLLPPELAVVETDAVSEDFQDGLQALNAAYAPKAFHLSVPKNFDADKPLQFLFWNTGKLNLSSPLLQVDVGSSARIRFIESHAGPAGDDYFSNSVVQVKVDPQAHVSWLKIQEESHGAIHIGRTAIVLERDCHLENFLFSTGAQLGRHTLSVVLNGTGSTAQVNGVYTASGRQHVDCNTTIDHKIGHCQTEQLYKGLLDGESRAVFNGKVLIRRQAQKANSNQLNNNLLLSGRAEVDTKPMLQIDADDVKATHGSTVGQLNKEELFYLLSRAIPKKKAIPMLSYGFLSEVVEKLHNEDVRQWLTAKLNEAFEKLHLESL